MKERECIDEPTSRTNAHGREMGGERGGGSWIQLAQGSNEVMGDTGTNFRGCHPPIPEGSPLVRSDTMILHALKDIARRFKSAAEPLDGGK